VKKKIILLASLACLMLLAMAAPVFALPPPSPESFTNVVLSLTTNPGTVTTMGTWEYIFHTGGIRDLFGAPWGNSISSTYTGTVVLNTANWVGGLMIFATDTYAAGVINSEASGWYTGLGSYVYNGPTIRYTLGTMTGTITSGTSYFGILSHGQVVGTGASGSLRGLKVCGTFTGVAILQGPNEGVILSVGSGIACR